MDRKLAKAVASAGVGYAGWQYLNNKYALKNDLELMYRVGKSASEMKFEANTTVSDVWEATVAKHPNKKCLIFTEDHSEMTFAQVDEMANKVAIWAREKAKFNSGDVIGIFVTNSPAFIWLLLGLNKAGLVVALINTNNKGRPLLHSLEVASCKALIFGTDLAANVQGVRAELQQASLPLFALDQPNGSHVDNAVMLQTELDQVATSNAPKSYRSQVRVQDTFGFVYTSGTTGLPKACIITNQKFLLNSFSCRTFGVSEKDTMYTCLPLYHSSGLLLGFGSTVVTGSTFAMARRFSASRFMQDCAETGATAAQYIGELCRYLLNTPPSEFDQAHSLRIAIGNGLRREIWVEFQQRFNIPEIGEFYGSTEGNVAFANHCRGVLNGDYSMVGALGRMGPLLRRLIPFKIIKHDVETEMPVRDPKTGFCVECKPGEPGELLGPITEERPFKGYTSKEATDKKVMTDVLVKGDSYFRTGDLIKAEEDGRLYFVDRIGDTFRWKGENVSTGEVSEVINTFPGVLEANVYGVVVPGHEDGRACMAALVLEENVNIEELGAFLQKDLASYALPLFLRILPEMEITGTFKHRKVEFVKDGFNPQSVADPLYFFDTNERKYKPLDEEAYTFLTSPRAKL
eukprot:CAMPEP_0184542000 /NCGR_PEP_ID=MMETSP0199_2-20130426/1736_1 /TAXON_ID=1112570 /ORGANISM="Thraustochytrium sp., Strain LLF1b" /LENGTH=629 /DNA_ID=CAMNT_0026935759 /DNA_START=161 /DNA_END=2050 /DNA_ORIENTATION=-